MRSVMKPDPPAPPRSRLLIGLVVATSLLLILALTLVIQAKPGDKALSSVTTLEDESHKSEASTSPAGSRDEVVARLRAIFRVRDRAIQTRDPDVLNSIYTVDCPCLEGDRALIQGLQKKGLVWRGIKVSLVIEESTKVNDRLWVVNALVKTSPFNIEQESGALVKSVPSGHERSRFALAKPVGQERWLLGQASIIPGRD